MTGLLLNIKLKHFKPYLLKSQAFTLSWQLIFLHACLCPHIPFEVHVTFKLQYATLTVSAPVVKGRLSSLQSLDVPVCLTLLYKKAFQILFDFTVFVLGKRKPNMCFEEDIKLQSANISQHCNICNYLYIFVMFIKKEDTSKKN